MRAGVVEQLLSDVLPYRVRPIKPDRVERLDFDDTIAANALYAKDVPRNLRQPALLNRNAGRAGRARI
jgi:hypothetical protein